MWLWMTCCLDNPRLRLTIWTITESSFSQSLQRFGHFLRQQLVTQATKLQHERSHLPNKFPKFPNLGMEKCRLSHWVWKERRQDTWGDFTSYNLESWNWVFLKIATLGSKCVFLDQISPNFNLKNMISIYTKDLLRGKKWPKFARFWRGKKMQFARFVW